ncbi:MAG: hypothetical protein R3Y32_08780 [Bacillota bacterium]
MNFLLLNLSVGGYVAIGLCLVVQWILAIIALMKLFGDKVKMPWCILWNIFIVAGIFIGPITYIVVSKIKNGKRNKNA